MSRNKEVNHILDIWKCKSHMLVISIHMWEKINYRSKSKRQVHFFFFHFFLILVNMWKYSVHLWQGKVPLMVVQCNSEYLGSNVVPVSIYPNKITTLSKYSYSVQFPSCMLQGLRSLHWTVSSSFHVMESMINSPPCTQKQRTTLMLMNGYLFTSDSFILFNLSLRTSSHCSLLTHSPPSLSCIDDLLMNWWIDDSSDHKSLLSWRCANRSQKFMGQHCDGYSLGYVWSPWQPCSQREQCKKLCMLWRRRSAWVRVCSEKPGCILLWKRQMWWLMNVEE